MTLTSGHAAQPQTPPREAPQDERRTVRPPLTPMIDVTFLLLLFFLLTFTFRVAEGTIPGTLPGGSDPEPIAETIVVDVVRPLDPMLADAGVFFIDNERFDSPESLYRELVRSKTIAEAVSIKPSRGVRWQHVVDAFNQAARAKYDKIGLHPTGCSAAATDLRRADSCPGVELAG